MISRREFVLGGIAALGLAGCRRSGGCEYSVPVLGDIHFDSTDTGFYHAHYTHSTTEKRYRNHLKEHVRNAEMWKARMPSLVRASAACAREDAAFALQLGDLVQGDCGDAAVHRRMLEDAFGFVKRAYGGRLPLVVAAGNHDIRGDIESDGARDTLERWLPAAMSKELGIAAEETSFLFRHGPDAFAVVDFNEPRPRLEVLSKLLSGCDGARHVFVVSHGPAIPNGSSRWFLAGGEKRDGERRALRAMLARRNAIVLCGHTHKLELCDCVFPEGRITQFVFNSVWAKPGWIDAKILAEGAEEYEKRARGSGARPAEEYAPHVKDWLLASAAGHYRLEVSGERVDVVFYGGDSTAPQRTFRLRTPAS